MCHQRCIIPHKAVSCIPECERVLQWPNVCPAVSRYRPMLSSEVANTAAKACTTDRMKSA